MKIKVKKLNEDAQIPKYQSKGAACFDLHSTDTGVVQEKTANVFGTGLSFEIPENHVMLVFSRSGHGFKHGVRLLNCVGVIDSDYRGEVKVGLQSDKDFMFVNKGDRIAQAMVLPVQQVVFDETEELEETDRGSNGFGSTGLC